MLKKSLLTVFIAVSSAPLVAIAGLGGMGSPAPVQSFHSAESPASQKADASDLAQVQALMAKAKKDAEQKKLASAADAAKAEKPLIVADNSKTLAPKIASNPSNDSNDLAGQISTLSQTNLMFQQRTDQQIEALTSKNVQLSDQLTRMGEAITLLNQEVVQLSSKLSQFQNSPAAAQGVALSQWDRLKNEFVDGVPYLLYAVLAALIIIILLMLPWYRKQQHKPALAMAAANAEVSDEGEYDFMGTHEAIPAKLDLARAYLAMEDHSAATQVLEEVCKDGNADQRREAENLLNTIPKKS